MKNAKKVLVLLLCAVILIGASIAGTVAYLTDSDNVVTNTFTVGKVEITMVETKVDLYGVALTGDDAGTNDGNKYKLIPGHTYTKDPTITVGANSEDCYILVKIANGLGTDAELNMSDSWAKVSETGNESVWVYGTADDPTSVSANGTVTPFDNFTFGTEADPTEYEEAEIIVTGYAIQADGLDAKTAAELWTLLNQ